MEGPYKVVLVGEETTGKTTIYRALTEAGDYFEEKYKPSVGPPKQTSLPKSSDTDIDVTLFDTGGQLRHRAYAISTLKEAHGVLLVYDVGRMESFQGMQEQEWVRHIKETAREGVVIFLVGNKSDVGEGRQVPSQDGENYAQGNGLASFSEISAKDRSSVSNLFQQLKARLVEK